MTTNRLDRATNFALDFQELAAAGGLSAGSVADLLERHEADKDGLTVSFQDGSACTWEETEGSWRLHRRVEP